MRTTCGVIDAKYGTQAPAAALNNRLPPGTLDRRCQAW